MGNIINKIKGTIYGQVIGNALALGTEGMTEGEISQKYPNGITHYSDIFQYRHSRRWKIGDWPDDTDMMRCILDTFVACLKDDTFDITRRFKEWMMNGIMGIGRHTYNVMALSDYTKQYDITPLIWRRKRIYLCKSHSVG